MENSTLSARAILLIAMQAMGGRVQGRTLLQKRIYFLGELLGEDLGFRSHFYGPYSSVIHGEAVQATTLGLLHESSTSGSTMPGETGRVDYMLTKNGADTARRLSMMRQEEAEKIQEAVNRIMESCGALDGASLSIAAKVHYILTRRTEEPLNLDQIREEAQKLNWEVAPEKITAGAESLVALGLVHEVEA